MSRAKRVRISEPAETDLQSIYAYIAEESPEAAEQFITELVGYLYRIAELHLPGSNRDWLEEGLRAIPYKQRVIYFRDYPEHIEIVRILHGKQDVHRAFGEEDF